MAKVAKMKPTASKAVKKTTRTTVSATTVLKNDFKAKILELKKQFNKQVKEIKSAAQAKAIATAQELSAKHEQAKAKAVKEAVSAIEKARLAKVKAEKIAKSTKPVKATKAAPAVKAKPGRKARA